ncbi:MAG: ABC transporter permease [Alphaproteobacteria bacterium]|nr:ABC transporter permease [Alphaproteobacteria bacterium]
MTSWRGAVDDVVSGLARWPQWLTLGNHELLQRYRRSVLGPLWITLSMGATVVGLGALYAEIFQLPLGRYLPYLTLGLIVWSFIVGCLLDGCQAFIANEPNIKQIYTPLSVFIYRVLWRNLMTLLHNALVYVIVVAICGPAPGWAALAAIPGLILLACNLCWIASLLALVCSRFRDIPPIVASLTSLAFLATPILWRPESRRVLREIAALNPFFHGIELVRAPLLGEPVAWEAFAAAVLTALLGGLTALLLYGRYRRRVSYWL